MRVWASSREIHDRNVSAINAATMHQASSRYASYVYTYGSQKSAVVAVTVAVEEAGVGRLHESRLFTISSDASAPRRQRRR